MITSINIQCKWFTEIHNLQWFIHRTSLDSPLSRWKRYPGPSPQDFPWNTFPCEIQQWLSYFSKVWDIVPEKGKETQYLPDLLFPFWWFHLMHHLNLFRISISFTGSKYVTDKCHLRLFQVQSQSWLCYGSPSALMVYSACVEVWKLSVELWNQSMTLITGALRVRLELRIRESTASTWVACICHMSLKPSAVR